MKHERRSADVARPPFYVVAIAPESDIASSAIQILSDAGLVARGGEGSRVWGFQVCCTDFAHARAAITAHVAYRTGDMDLFVLTHCTREDERGHRDDLRDLAAYRQHIRRRWEISAGLIAEPGGPANESEPIRSETDSTSSAARSRR